MASRAPAVAVVFGLSLLLIAAVALPLWRPLLLAAVIAGPLSGWHDRLAGAFGGRRTISAALFTLAIFTLLLLPIAAAVFFAVEQALQLTDVVRHTLEQKGVAALLQPLPEQIQHWIQQRYGQIIAEPRKVLSELHVWSRTGWALGALIGFLSSLSSLLFALLMLLIATFFLLRDGHSLIAWLRQSGLLPRDEVDRLLTDLRGVSKSIVGGNVVTGAAQGAVATLGYFIAGVPSPLLFGLLTFVASFIPTVGVAIIAVPVVGLMLLLDHTGWAVFLAGWMAIVVGLVDNFVRPLLMRGPSNLHGALIFFSLIGGVFLFGGMGVVVGPLALVFFLTMTKALRRRTMAPAGR